MHVGSCLHFHTLWLLKYFSQESLLSSSCMGVTKSTIGMSLVLWLSSFSLCASHALMSAEVLEDRSHTAMRNNYLVREPCVDPWEILTAGNEPILHHQSKNASVKYNGISRIKTKIKDH